MPQTSWCWCCYGLPAFHTLGMALGQQLFSNSYKWPLRLPQPLFTVLPIIQIVHKMHTPDFLFQIRLQNNIHIVHIDVSELIQWQSNILFTLPFLNWRALHELLFLCWDWLFVTLFFFSRLNSVVRVLTYSFCTCCLWCDWPYSVQHNLQVVYFYNHTHVTCFIHTHSSCSVAASIKDED